MFTSYYIRRYKDDYLQSNKYYNLTSNIYYFITRNDENLYGTQVYTLKICVL